MPTITRVSEMAQRNENELEHATDGALRVARRQMIKSAQLAQKATERLEQHEYGDETREGVYHKTTTNTASGYQAADLIEDELDRRDADYKPRSEISP